MNTTLYIGYQIIKFICVGGSHMARYLYLAVAFALFSATTPAIASTKVVITVDVESYGRDGDPEKQIWGKLADGEHGIRRIMDLLDKHGVKGTFYLNVYEAAKYGDAALARVARAINDRGHDLELHTHPAPVYGISEMQKARWGFPRRAFLITSDRIC